MASSAQSLNCTAPETTSTLVIGAPEQRVPRCFARRVRQATTRSATGGRKKTQKRVFAGRYSVTRTPSTDRTD
eukprot:7807800-Alexandrium_andersonii.AAC.1